MLRQSAKRAHVPAIATIDWENEPCRCPPGHGDIYPSLLGSGFLDRLLAKGIKYLFVSNSDNLGATLDVDLLAYFAKTDKAFLMEVRSSSFFALRLVLGLHLTNSVLQCILLHPVWHKD